MVIKTTEEYVEFFINLNMGKEIAESMNPYFKNQIIENNKILWTEILEKVEHDELIYKLTLKFLRRDGYDIGNHKIPEVKSFTP